MTWQKAQYVLEGFWVSIKLSHWSEPTKRKQTSSSVTKSLAEKDISTVLKITIISYFHSYISILD